MLNRNTSEFAKASVLVVPMILAIMAVCAYSVGEASYTVTIRSMGTVIGNTTTPPSQPIGFPTWITTLASLTVILTALAAFFRWLTWKAKYWKCRTPISLGPPSTHRITDKKR